MFSLDFGLLDGPVEYSTRVTPEPAAPSSAVRETTTSLPFLLSCLAVTTGTLVSTLMVWETSRLLSFSSVARAEMVTEPCAVTLIGPLPLVHSPLPILYSIVFSCAVMVNSGAVVYRPEPGAAESKSIATIGWAFGSEGATTKNVPSALILPTPSIEPSTKPTCSTSAYSAAGILSQVTL